MMFARFVAVDWSGARGPGYGGIAVARCGAGGGQPELVAPPDGRHWRRTDVLAWMLAAMDGPPTLFGFDFAFALPFCDRGSYLPPGVFAAATPRALWQWVDATCAGDPDFFAGRLIDMPALAGLFWSAGKRPAGFAERLRLSDRTCRDAGLGRPQSVYKLIGAAQVGKGSLAGMRFLHALCQAAGDRIAVWPFAVPEGQRHVCCEIYPGLFAAAGGGRGKVRDAAHLTDILGSLGCSEDLPAAAMGNDHEADALVSAAGLRYYAGRAATWRPSAMTAEAAAREGWIVGLG